MQEQYFYHTSSIFSTILRFFSFYDNKLQLVYRHIARKQSAGTPNKYTIAGLLDAGILT